MSGTVNITRLSVSPSVITLSINLLEPVLVCHSDLHEPPRTETRELQAKMFFSEHWSTGVP